MLLTFCFDLFRRRLGLGFQRRHGLPYLLQPSLPKRQFLRQLVATPVLAVPPVLLLIHLLGPPQQLRHLRRQLLLFLFHPPVTHRLVFGGVGPHLGAVQRHVTQLHQPRPLAKRQHLQKQPRQCCQVVLAEVGDGAEVWGVVRRQHPKGDVLVEPLGDPS